MYIATVTTKDGKTLYISAAHPTREGAANEAFLARPRAKSCSTCIAVQQNNEWVRSHSCIEWHRRK